MNGLHTGKSGEEKQNGKSGLPRLLFAAALLIAAVGLGISGCTDDRGSDQMQILPMSVSPAATPDITAMPTGTPLPANTPAAADDEDSFASFVAELRAVKNPYEYAEAFDLAYYKKMIPTLPTAEMHTHLELLGQGPLTDTLLFDRFKENNRLYLASHPEETSITEFDDETLLRYCGVLGNFMYQELSFVEGLDINEMLCKIGSFKLLRTTEAGHSCVETNDDFCMVVSEKSVANKAEYDEECVGSYNDIMDAELIKAAAYLLQKPCLDRRMPGIVRQGVGVTVPGEQQDPYAWKWLSDACAVFRSYGYTAEGTHEITRSTQWLTMLAYANLLNESTPISDWETVSYGNDRAEFYRLLPALRPEEIDQMMYSIDIGINRPQGFQTARDAIWGKEAISEAEQYSDDSRSDTEVSLQASVLGTLSRSFYLGLSSRLRNMGQEELRAAYSDVFYLIKVWEAGLNYHIGFIGVDARDSVYVFQERYTHMQDIFFRWFAEQSGAPFEEVVQLFGAYTIAEGTTPLQLNDARMAVVDRLYADSGWSMRYTYEDGEVIWFANARDCYANERAARERAQTQQ